MKRIASIRQLSPNQLSRERSISLQQMESERKILSNPTSGQPYPHIYSPEWDAKPLVAERSTTFTDFSKGSGKRTLSGQEVGVGRNPAESESPSAKYNAKRDATKVHKGGEATSNSQPNDLTKSVTFNEFSMTGGGQTSVGNFSSIKRSDTSHDISGTAANFSNTSMSGAEYSYIGGTPHYIGQSSKQLAETGRIVLTTAKLKDLCLRLLTDAQKRIELEKQAKSAARLRLLKFQREVALKFKASVTAISFTAILIKRKLEQFARKMQQQTADPYIVVPGMLDPLKTVGRELCIFRCLFRRNYTAEPFELYFALDRQEGTTHDVFIVHLVPLELLDNILIHFQMETPAKQAAMGGGNNGVGVTNLDFTIRQGGMNPVNDICVIATYNPELLTLEPVCVQELNPNIGPHHFIIRQFRKEIDGTIHEDDEGCGDNEKGFLEALKTIEGHQPQGGGANNSSTAVQSPLNEDGALSYEEAENLQKLLEIFAVPLPRYEEMAILPQEVQDAIYKLGEEVLQRYLYPRLLLKRRTVHRRKIVNTSYVPLLTVEQLQKLPVWNSWPVSLLEELIKRVKPLVVEKGEFIIHEDENAQSGIYFLVAGTVDVLKKIQRNVKSIGPSNTRVLVSLGAIICVGEYAFLTEDPRMASIKATSLCSLWRLEKQDFHELFPRLPPSVKSNITEVAFQKRTANVLNTFPLSISLLREYPIFANSGEDCLKKIIALINPHAVPKGTTITKRDENSRHLFFLRRGRCGVFRYVKEKHEELHIVTLNPPAVIGDDSVIFDLPYTTTIKALTNCDFYSLSKEEFESVMVQYPSNMEQIINTANQTRQAQLTQSQYRFKEMVVNLPFVRDLLSLTKRTELLPKFAPLLYHPRQIICSTATFADRVIILVDGTVRFDNGSLWEQGEAVGFSCVIPHRWMRSAVASTSAKMIELSHEEYVHFLKKHEIYDAVCRQLKALMFPKAADSTTLFEAIVSTQHLKTPPMYPVSHAPTVDLHQPHFGLDLVKYGLNPNYERTRARLKAKQEEDYEDAEANPVTIAVQKDMQQIEQNIKNARPCGYLKEEDRSLKQGRRKWSNGRSLMIERVPTLLEWRRRKTAPNNPDSPDSTSKDLSAGLHGASSMVCDTHKTRNTSSKLMHGSSMLSLGHTSSIQANSMLLIPVGSQSIRSVEENENSCSFSRHASIRHHHRHKLDKQKEESSLASVLLSNSMLMMTKSGRQRAQSASFFSTSSERKPSNKVIRFL